VPTATTFIRAYADGTPPPQTSSLNTNSGLTKGNLAVVGVGANGRIDLYNNAGTVNLTVDVVGYLAVHPSPDATTAGRIVPLSTPARLIDTRSTTGPLSGGQADTWSLSAFVQSLAYSDGTPAGVVAAAVATVTDLFPTAGGYLVAYPATSSLTGTASVNFPPGVVTNNLTVLAIPPAGTANPGSIRVYTSAGQVGYVLDVSAVVLG
jgi:hypothetical protein